MEFSCETGNLLLLVGGIVARISGGNVIGIIFALRFLVGKGTDAEISGTFNQTEIGVFRTVLNGIQLKLLAVLLSLGHNEYIKGLLFIFVIIVHYFVSFISSCLQLFCFI